LYGIERKVRTEKMRGAYTLCPGLGAFSNVPDTAREEQSRRKPSRRSEYTRLRRPKPEEVLVEPEEVLVDTERGVLLRCASRLRGKDFDALEVEEIYFDEQFSEEVFTSREPLPWR
jgi:hypothetical protein